MATIITKNSSTASSVPLNTQLVQGELAVNVTDKRLYTQDATDTVVELGTNPSSLTLPNGTANAVPYLNASKVLTSGSALTFDGTNFATTGTATATQVQATSGAPGFSISNQATAAARAQFTNTGGTVYIGLDNSAGGLGGSYTMNYWYTGNYPHVWALNNAEQMRLTSTGLGIGTSSPGAKLDVAGAAKVTGILKVQNPTQSVIHLSSADGSSGFQIFRSIGGTDDQNLNIYDYALAQNVVQLKSGNLGLGVTPSAWATNSQAIQNSSGAFWQYGGGNVYVGQNYYLNSSLQRIYSTTGAAATEYQQGGGGHRWYTAPSGTAGAAISFTQAMTLDASGNLGVGTTSPGYRLEASTTVAATSGVQDVAMFRAFSSGSTDSTFGARLLLGTENPNGNSWPAGIAAINDAGGSNLSSLGFYTATSGPTLNERARIDSSGNFLLGTATAGAGIGFGLRLAVDSGSGETAVFKTSGGASSYSGRFWNSATTGDNLFVWFGTEAGGTTRGSITYNRAGGLTAYNTTSDYRAKEIYGPITDSGSVIDSVPVYIGKMKGATQERPMFIAHETPDYAHTGEKDAVDADGNPVYQQMDASSLVPVLWAEVQSLRKRIAALDARLVSLEAK